MGVNFEKWRYDFDIFVQKPGYSVLTIEKTVTGLHILSADIL